MTRISRRTLLQAGAASAIASPAILARPAAAEDNILYVNNWGGTIAQAEDAAWYKPFTAATGIEIRTVSPVSVAKLKAEVQTRNYEWDVTAIDRMEYLQAEEEGLVEPLDFSVFDKSKIRPGGIYHNGVTTTVLGTNLVYRKDKFLNGGPRNWADFWNVQKFPGNRSLIDQPFTVLAYALLADGVARDKLYPMDLDRAFKSLDRIKPHIKVWWTQGGQSETLIRDGEVDMIALWSARGENLIDQGVPLEVVWDGAQTYASIVFMPKGTPRKKLAMRFMEFVAQAKAQADFADILPYGPTNPASIPLMKPAQVKKIPTSPEHLAVSFEADAEWLAPNMPKIRERWSQWMAG